MVNCQRIASEDTYLSVFRQERNFSSRYVVLFNFLSFFIISLPWDLSCNPSGKTPPIQVTTDTSDRQINGSGIQSQMVYGWSEWQILHISYNMSSKFEQMKAAFLASKETWDLEWALLICYNVFCLQMQRLKPLKWSHKSWAASTKFSEKMSQFSAGFC